jgi:uncharacterized protein (DUF433 family)
MTFNSINLPIELQQEVEKWATSQGIPLDQFILSAVAEKVASLRSRLNDPSFPTISYSQGFSGNSNAVISGTGIRVQTIAIAAHKWKLSPQQVREEYGLTQKQCQDALDFYAVHRNEIDKEIAIEEAIEATNV